MKPVYLRCLDVEKNHYKYYKMIPLNADTFLVEYGREGASPQKKEYPMSKWDTQYRAKIKKGYEDVSEYTVLSAKSNNSDVTRVSSSGEVYAEIPDAGVRELVAQLLAMSKQVVSANYDIATTLVTKKMIDDAQRCINELVNDYKLFENEWNGVRHYTRMQKYIEMFNAALLSLLKVMPRKIRKVSSVLIQEINESVLPIMKKRIDIEESLLDNMRTCVAADIIYADDKEEVSCKDKTLLEALGLEITPCDDKDIKKIQACFTQDDIRYGLDKRVITAYKVRNKATETKYNKFKKMYKDEYTRFPTRLLWHGSRNENWWSIINQGLKIRPSNAVHTGSMFGDGLYFADKAKKSYGYTSSSHACYVRGNANVVFMALYSVLTGNELCTETNRDFYNMTFDKLRGITDTKGRHYHSVSALAGSQLRNNEIIVYNPSQVTIQYLVMFRG